MFPAYFNQRLKDLEDNILKCLLIMKDQENADLMKSSSQLRQEHCLEIERIKLKITQFQKERQELQSQLNTSPSLQTSNTKNQFQQIDDKLNILIIKQDTIANDLATTRQNLLNRYSVTEQVVVRAIAEQLNQFQLALTQELLYAIETNRVSERQIVEMLVEVEKNIPSLPPSKAEKLAKVIKDPALDSKHKLKVSLPIIPLIVGYEGSIELGSGIDLKLGWEQLLAKLRRNPKVIPGKPIGNYTRLREFLKAKQWREADLETARVMLKATGREKQGWLSTQDIEKFPISDLKAIDSLWFNLSQNRFGFRVQREICLSLAPLSSQLNLDLSPEFSELVGWYQEDRWRKYEELTFSLDAPKGHLPSFPITIDIDEKNNPSIREDNFQDLLSKIENCQGN